jgi:membrane protein DedA with SNARE-associated domain
LAYLSIPAAPEDLTAVFEIHQAIERLTERADEQSATFIFLVMFGGSLLEYICPPLPGDFCTVAGAILIARGHRFLTIFLAVNLGAATGFLIDYGFGVWLADPARPFRHRGPRWERLGRGIDRIARGFEKHTALYLVVNRFLPGVRALFFVAAGFARVPLWKVVVFGLASAALWNLLLIGAGFTVGRNLDRLLAFLAIYNQAAFAVLATTAGVLLARWWIRRRRSSGDAAD